MQFKEYRYSKLVAGYGTMLLFNRYVVHRDKIIFKINEPQFQCNKSTDLFMDY